MSVAPETTEIANLDSAADEPGIFAAAEARPNQQWIQKQRVSMRAAIQKARTELLGLKSALGMLEHALGMLGRRGGVQSAEQAYKALEGWSLTLIENYTILLVVTSYRERQSRWDRLIKSTEAATKKRVQHLTHGVVSNPLHELDLVADNSGLFSTAEASPNQQWIQKQRGWLTTTIKNTRTELSGFESTLWMLEHALEMLGRRGGTQSAEHAYNALEKRTLALIDDYAELLFSLLPWTDRDALYETLKQYAVACLNAHIGFGIFRGDSSDLKKLQGTLSKPRLPTMWPDL